VLGKAKEQTMSKNITRRRFLVLGGGAGLSAFLGGAYLVSGCPLSDSGVCVGPCAAYIDRVGDGLCDRAYADQATAQAVAQAPGGDDTVGQAFQPDASSSDAAAAQAYTVACPLGLVNDPYPGKCRRYVDRDGDGICDLSVPQAVGRASVPDTDAGQASVPDSDVGQALQPDNGISSTPQPQLGVACPFGLVNDPYPGECRRYVDLDGDGICDLSMPGSGLNAPGDTRVGEEDGQRRGRGWGGGRR
jgi:hypothetical protein